MAFPGPSDGLHAGKVQLLDQVTNLTGTRAEPECPAALVPENPGELGGLSHRSEVVMPGAVRAAAVDHVAGPCWLDAGESGAGVVGGERGVHTRTMRPVVEGVKVARKTRRTRNSRSDDITNTGS